MNEQTAPEWRDCADPDELAAAVAAGVEVLVVFSPDDVWTTERWNETADQFAEAIRRGARYRVPTSWTWHQEPPAPDEVVAPDDDWCEAVLNDLNSIIHGHCGSDGSDDAHCDWVNDLANEVVRYFHDNADAVQALLNLPDPASPTPTYRGADWLARNLKIELSEPQRRCAQALWDMTRIYNLSDGGTTPHIAPTGLAVLCRSELSTYDSANLTRLVLAAHRHRVRVSVRAWSPDLECPDARDTAWLAELAEELQNEAQIAIDPTNEVGIAALAFGWTEIRLTVREFSPDDWYSHHPSLEDLVAHTDQVDP